MLHGQLGEVVAQAALPVAGTLRRTAAATGPLPSAARTRFGGGSTLRGGSSAIATRFRCFLAAPTAPGGGPLR